MKRKWVLIISGALLAIPALASEDYSHCFDDNTTDVCQAFIAGMESGYLESSETEKAVFVERSADKDSWFSRALEQRAGGRYRTPISLEKG
ncbi:hypothetical protein [Enterovibrio baiacu]|uniref:hypothetical protein n=1 Tax=Enterovibrio baiacu TaxID=2491023 RepID=UPI0010139AC9|nr:hypothetical protein [Enterovibrio baiacu]MBE1277549.1 hypothetical protein [Enterovibrio baiacu]